MGIDSFQADLIQRINALIMLQLDHQDPSKPMSMSAKIYRLRDLGMTPTTIAGIVGKPLNYVTATLGRKRKGSTRG
jgi:hypothetical protein